MALGLNYMRYPVQGMRPALTRGELLLEQAIVLNDYSPTFTRASTAYDPYNLVTAISGARRRRPLPLSRTMTVFADLFEPARTNLCIRSQEFENAAWTRTDTTPTANAATAPDGTLTADLLTEGTAGTAATTSTAVTITAGSVIVTSVYLLASANAGWIHMRLSSNAGSNGVRAWFNISTGALGSTQAFGTGTAISSAITREGGYYRLVLVSKVDAAATAAAMNFFSASADLSLTRTNNAAYYAWGAQIEQMPASATTGYASSYIATTSASVARAQDVITVPYVLGQTGTILALCIPYGWTGDQDGISAWSAFRTDGNITRMERSSANTFTLRTVDGGGAQGPNLATTLANGVLAHAGMTWDSSAVLGYSNGALVGTDNTLVPPYIRDNTIVRIGSASGASGAFGGWLALLALPGAASASDFLALDVALPAAA